MGKAKVCGMKTEIWSRVVGYHRPIFKWCAGQREQFKDRKTYDVDKALNNMKVPQVKIA